MINTRFSDSKFPLVMENSIQAGNCVLLLLEDYINPVIHSLLNKEYLDDDRKIKFNESEIRVHPDF